MGRRQQRRKPTRREKIEGQGQKRGNRKEKKGLPSREFSDLSPMTQEIVAGVAARQQCTKEEILEVLNR